MHPTSDNPEPDQHCRRLPGRAMDFLQQSSTITPSRIINMEGLELPLSVTVMPTAQNAAPTAEEKPERDSPQLDGIEDDELDVNQDDAQIFLQPAISPLATLLTSPRTPAADKAAAFDRQPGDGL